MHCFVLESIACWIVAIDEIYCLCYLQPQCEGVLTYGMTRHPVDLTPKIHHPDDRAIEAIPKLLFPFCRNLLLGAYPDSRVPDLLLLIGHI